MTDAGCEAAKGSDNCRPASLREHLDAVSNADDDPSAFSIPRLGWRRLHTYATRLRLSIWRSHWLRGFQFAMFWSTILRSRERTPKRELLSFGSASQAKLANQRLEVVALSANALLGEVRDAGIELAAS